MRAAALSGDRNAAEGARLTLYPPTSPAGTAAPTARLGRSCFARPANCKTKGSPDRSDPIPCSGAAVPANRRPDTAPCMSQTLPYAPSLTLPHPYAPNTCHECSQHPEGGGESKHMCPCLPTAERCPLGFATCCRAGKVREKLPYGSESHYSQCRAGLGSPSRLSFHFGAFQLHGLFLPLVQQSSGAGSSPGRADGFGLNSDRAAQRGSSTSTST